MEVIEGVNHFDKISNAIVTIGTFDGVHLGHQAILRKVIEEARFSRGKSVLITFWPHPRFILKHDSDLKLLSTFSEKEKSLENLGLDYIVKVPFTKEFSSLSAEEFVTEFLIERIGMKKLYIGYDHRFGNGREGDIEYLKKRAEEDDFQVFEIPKQEVDHVGVSSTKVRKALLSGDVNLASTLLGRNYSIEGEVVKGQQIGRTIGFPTANIDIGYNYKLLPKDGVYAIWALLDGDRYPAMMNIGIKPTFDSFSHTIEAHLFNFDRSLYGEELIIELVKFVRDEMKFSSLEELKSQLTADKTTVKKILDEKS